MRLIKQSELTRSEACPTRAAAARFIPETELPVTSMDHRPAAVAQRVLTQTIHQSPRMVAQRALIGGIQHSLGMVAQRAHLAQLFGTAPVQLIENAVPPPNDTGLPDQLKAGIENLSGLAMDDVKVHYNSSKPTQLQAFAYTQGTHIYVAPGQEKHLPHEAWHVAQQKQGRVKPTLQMKGVSINDDTALEHEADVMGARAQRNESLRVLVKQGKQVEVSHSSTQFSRTVQRKTTIRFGMKKYKYDKNDKSKTEEVGEWSDGCLDPADPKRGSAPGKGEIGKVMDAFNKLGYQNTIRGHLMNGQVGGPGLAQNLYPITSAANHKHLLLVENYVKQALKNGDGVHYNIRVDSTFDIDQPNATFKCKINFWEPDTEEEGDKILELGIKSLPRPGSTGGVSLVGNPKASLTFDSKNLPSNWGEKGSGNPRGKILNQGHYFNEDDNEYYYYERHRKFFLKECQDEIVSKYCSENDGQDLEEDESRKCFDQLVDKHLIEYWDKYSSPYDGFETGFKQTLFEDFTIENMWQDYCNEFPM